MPKRTVPKPMGDVEIREFDEREWGATSEELAVEEDRTRNDWIWYSNHIVALRKKYLNKWVAVRLRRVVMADADHDTLLRRLKARPEGRDGAEIFYVAPKGVEYIF